MFDIVREAERLVWLAERNSRRADGTWLQDHCYVCRTHATFYDSCSCGFMSPTGYCIHCHTQATATHSCSCGFKGPI